MLLELANGFGSYVLETPVAKALLALPKVIEYSIISSFWSHWCLKDTLSTSWSAS